MENTSVLYVMAWIQIAVIITELMSLQNRTIVQIVEAAWREMMMNEWN